MGKILFKKLSRMGRFGVVALMYATLAAMPAITPFTGQKAAADDYDYGNSSNVQYCHAKPADTAANGWNYMNTAPQVVFQSGHPQHDADIIPPFTYTTGGSHGSQHSFPGLNWDARGQAIFNNGCNMPNMVTPVPPAVTNPTCENLSGIIHFTNQPGYVYYYNGLPYLSDLSVPAGATYAVTMQAFAPGYVFPDFSTTKMVDVSVGSVPTDCKQHVTIPVPPAQIELCGQDNDEIITPYYDHSKLTMTDTGWAEGERTISFSPKEGYEIMGQSSWTFYDEGGYCGATIPNMPEFTDECGLDNAQWVLPEDTDAVHYELSEDGHLWAIAKDGYMFDNESTEHDYGVAPDSGEACPTEGGGSGGGEVLGETTTTPNVLAAVAATPAPVQAALEDTGSSIVLPVLLSVGVLMVTLLTFSQDKNSKLAVLANRLKRMFMDMMNEPFVVPMA